MYFNSLTYAVFFCIVFAGYWFLLQSNRSRNVLLLISSYVFYGWWDWRFLSLLFVSTSVDYVVGRLMATGTRRRRYLLLSLATNLGILGVFKYFNFFTESFAAALASFGFEIDTVTLNVVLPVGISFYTFQTLSYTIDVYRKRIEPTNDLVAFAAYVAFFPQLVAGPIERATQLLPQFAEPKSFSYEEGREGLRQILWGLFKKVVVADNCGEIADVIFENSTQLTGPLLVLGTVLFAFQIYGDFSGYSDIAIGSARLLGFRLMQNFAFPYFSRDIAEFWRRWHISLSTWFRDYVYIPLGGSRTGTLQGIRNVFIIFLVSGLWHGANWTFVIWGALNAFYFLPLLLSERNRRYLDVASPGRLLPTVDDAMRILLTFSLTCIAWIFFRSASVEIAFQYLGNMFVMPSTDLGEQLRELGIPLEKLTSAVVPVVLMTVVEWLQRTKQYGLESIRLPFLARWTIYLALTLSILEYSGTRRQFIYFQF